MSFGEHGWTDKLLHDQGGAGMETRARARTTPRWRRT